MYRHAFVCCVLALLLGMGAGALRAQSMRFAAVSGPVQQARLAPAAAERAPGAAWRGAARYAPSPAASDHDAALWLMIEEHLPPERRPMHARDLLDAILNPPIPAPNGFLSDFALLYRAQAFVHQMTTYEGHGFSVQVDPLKPRCTLQISLQRRTLPADTAL